MTATTATVAPSYADFEGMVKHFARQHAQVANLCSDDQDELQNVLRLIAWKCLRTYDPTRGFPASTYVANVLPRAARQWCWEQRLLRVPYNTFTQARRDGQDTDYPRVCASLDTPAQLRRADSDSGSGASDENIALASLPATDPEEIVLTRLAMRDAFAQLTENEARVAYLALAGYNSTEIAKQTGRTRQNAHSTQQRAFSNLRATLTREWGMDGYQAAGKGVG